MKILIIIDDYLPYSKQVAAKMVHELSCEYVNEGHEVTVLTPGFFQEENLKITMIDGVKVVNFKSGFLKSKSKVKRAINETLLSVRAWLYAKDYFKENPHDFIIYYSPTIFFGPLVNRLKSMWGVKSYLILRDLFPQWAIDYGVIKKGSLIEKYFRYFEKINYQAADTIGLMSKKNLEWFKEHGVDMIKEGTKVEISSI